MSGTPTQTNPQGMLETSAGPVPLQEYIFRRNGREWSILHAGAVLSPSEEERVIRARSDRLPYGVALWPSAIALAHEVAEREEDFRGTSVLELGAGTGLPGIVAATFGASVVQSDKDALSVHLCRRNGGRNGLASIAHRQDDWTAWDDAGRYDWILGADILYGGPLHEPLRRIFERNLAPGGKVLVADPFREAGLPLLEGLEADGWGVVMNRWEVGSETRPRPVGVFELTPPRG